jgi:hypothetical protein
MLAVRYQTLFCLYFRLSLDVADLLIALREVPAVVGTHHQTTIPLAELSRMCTPGLAREVAVVLYEQRPLERGSWGLALLPVETNPRKTTNPNFLSRIEIASTFKCERPNGNAMS